MTGRMLRNAHPIARLNAENDLKVFGATFDSVFTVGTATVPVAIAVVVEAAAIAESLSSLDDIPIGLPRSEPSIAPGPTPKAF